MGLFRGYREPVMKLNANELAALLGSLALTQDRGWIAAGASRRSDNSRRLSCRGKRPAEAVQLVRQHLAICGDCSEEYETLVAAIPD